MALFDETFSSQQLLSASAHVWSQSLSFINSMSLKCAIELGIFDIIHKHGRPITLSELTHALPINKQKSNCVDRLMRILIHSKFSVKAPISADDEKEGYWLTPASRLLLKEEPLGVATLALFMIDPLLLDSWHHLGEWFTNDTPNPFVVANGKSLGEILGNNPRMNRLTNEAMACDARCIASVVTRDCKHVFQGLKSVVDVGGGLGIMAKVIADAFPGLKCSVFDLPHVVSGMEGTDNLNFVGGDMFDFIPPANAVIIKSTLHNWSDEDCVTILKKCKEAIPRREDGGKVIIIEMVVVDDGEILKEREATDYQDQLFSDMMMMISSAGKERTEKQWKQLFSAAGYTSYKITHRLGSRSLIEIFP